MSWITENVYVPPPALRPTLNVFKSGTGSGIAVGWGDDATGYTLQTTEGLNPPGWVSIGSPIPGHGQHQEEEVPSEKFFRLIKP